MFWLLAQWYFVVAGDNRPPYHYLHQPPIFKRILEETNLIYPDFFVHTGDIVWGYGDEKMRSEIERQFREFLDVMKILRVPWYLAPGNHEIDPRGAKVARSIYDRVIGKHYYSFEHRGVGFVFLDTDYADRGKLGQEQIAWLEEVLKKYSRRDRFVVAVFHKPMYWDSGWRYEVQYEIPDEQGSDWADKAERDKVWELFKKYNVKYIFNGHEHLLTWFEKDGIHVYITGGGGAPKRQRLDEGGVYNYLVVEVPENGKNLKVNAVEPWNLWTEEEKIEEGSYAVYLRKKVVWNIRYVGIKLSGIIFDVPKKYTSRIGKDKMILPLYFTTRVEEYPFAGDPAKVRVSVVIPKGKHDAEAVLGIVDKPRGKLIPVRIDSYFNSDGVSSPDMGFDGNFDGTGTSYAAEFFPRKGKITVGDIPFFFPGERFWKKGAKNNIACIGQTIEVGGKKASAVYLLAASEWGDRGGKFAFKFSDGTVLTRQVKVTDWCMPPRNGEIGVIGAPYRRRIVGNFPKLDPTPNGMFVVRIPLKKVGRLESITLPSEPHLHVFAITLEQPR